MKQKITPHLWFDKEITFNKVSFYEVLGNTILLWGFSAVFILAGLNAQDEGLLILSFLVSLLCLGIWIFIYFLSEKSIIANNEGLIVELWLSKIFHLHKSKWIPWSSIEKIEYHGKLRITVSMGMTMLILYTTKGRFTFWNNSWANQEDQELKNLRDLIQEKKQFQK